MFLDFPFANGFDDIHNARKTIYEHIKRAESSTNYPPYNIRKKTENYYAIEIAAAGYSLSDFDIEFENGLLRIKCNPPKEDASTFIHRGLTNKSWLREFVLNDSVIVKSANLANGILEISLEQIVPEHKKPLKINIGSAILLNEG